MRSGSPPPAAQPAGYRESHRGAAKAADYDRDFWSRTSAKGQDWAIEQRLLELVFERHLSPAPESAVDFACGTGRVLQFLERRVPSTTGVDVSPEMLALARERCTGSTLIEHDVTRSAPSGLQLPVDLVTAFRFFLNAEPPLRRDALGWIRSALAPGGHLVANFHLNPSSLRGRYLRARVPVSRRPPMLSPDEVHALLAEAGFAVVARYGYEFLPFRRDGARLVFPRARAWVEDLLVDRAALVGAGAAFVVVARVL